MSATGMPERPAPRKQGRLGRMLVRLLMRRATVVAVEQVADAFRLITLEGPELAGVAWTAGQKIQIAMGSAFMARTYTPIRWDAAAGRTDILAHAHGDGPGSAWVRGVRPGDMCDLFGPRSSLDVPAWPGRWPSSATRRRSGLPMRWPMTIRPGPLRAISRSGMWKAPARSWHGSGSTRPACLRSGQTMRILKPWKRRCPRLPPPAPLSC